jgi:hypothetical protein
MIVNHLQKAEGEKLTLPLVFGKHIVNCQPIKSKVVGASPNHQIIVQQPIGDAHGYGWESLEAMWLKGQILPSANITFHPGTQSTGNADPIQGVNSEFPNDVPHTNTALTISKYPLGFGQADNKTNLPESSKGMFRCQKLPIFDSNGNITSVQFSTNPADMLAFLFHIKRKILSNRINWQSIVDLRNFFNQTETFNFRTQATGCGLWTEFFNDADLTPSQKVTERIEPVVFVPSTAGSFDFRQNPDNFSIRSEGFVQHSVSGTYTLYITCDNKVKVWFDGTLVIDDWNAAAVRQLSATVTVTANTFHTIKIEYGHLTGNAEIKLEMENGTVFPRQILKSKNLFPVNRTYKKWEVSVTFNDRTDIKEAIKRILFLSNSNFQFANGKYRFFCYDQLTTPTFTFDESNIIENSIKFNFPENLKSPNRFVAIGNDLDSQFYDPFLPQVVYQNEAFQNISTQIVEQFVDVANSTRFHTTKLLKARAKLEDTNTMEIEFDGKPITMQVLAGDLVQLNYAKYNWVNKLFLVVGRTKKLAKRKPENLSLKLREWSI